MFVKTSQTTDNSTAFFNRFSPSQQRKHQRTAWLVLCKWNTTDGLPSHRVNNAESVSMSWPYTLYDSEDENITHVLYCCVFSGDKHDQFVWLLCHMIKTNSNIRVFFRDISSYGATVSTHWILVVNTDSVFFPNCYGIDLYITIVKLPTVMFCEMEIYQKCYIQSVSSKSIIKIGNSFISSRNKYRLKSG